MANPDKDSSHNFPPWAQWLVNWWGLVFIPIGAVGLPLIDMFVPKEQATTVKALVCFGILLVLLVVLAIKRPGPITLGVVVTLLLICLGYVAYEPLDRWRSTRPPIADEATCVRCDYVNLSIDESLFQTAPFLNAVRASLEDEAKTDPQINPPIKSRLVLLVTKPLAHPTPSFRLGFRLDKDLAKKYAPCKIVGYAFAVREDGHRRSYEVVPVRYPSGDVELEFDVPPAEAASYLLFLGRLSVPAKTDSDFPPRNFGQFVLTGLSS
jgi:hypothetical protein